MMLLLLVMMIMMHTCIEKNLPRIKKCLKPPPIMKHCLPPDPNYKWIYNLVSFTHRWWTTVPASRIQGIGSCSGAGQSHWTYPSHKSWKSWSIFILVVVYVHLIDLVVLLLLFTLKIGEMTFIWGTLAFWFNCVAFGWNDFLKFERNCFSHWPFCQ